MLNFPPSDFRPQKTQSTPADAERISQHHDDAPPNRTSSQEALFGTRTSADAPKEIKATVMVQKKGNFFTRFFERLFTRLFGGKNTDQPFSSAASPPKESRHSIKEAAKHSPPPTPPARTQPSQSPPRSPAEQPEQSAPLPPPRSPAEQPEQSAPPLPQPRRGGAAAPAPPASNSSMPRSAEAAGPSIQKLRPTPSLIPQEFTEALARYRAAIESGDIAQITREDGTLRKMMGEAAPDTRQAMIAARQHVTKETKPPTMVEGRKLELTVEAGNAESIERGITVLHDYFIPKMMDCTDPQEMKQLMNDAHTLHENIRGAISQLPPESRNASHIQLANVLVPDSLSWRGKDYKLNVIAYGLRALNKHEQLSAKTGRQLVLSVVKHKTVADMIRIGTRPNRDNKEDTDLTRGFLRDASSNAHFGKMVQDDPSIGSMVTITNEWAIIGLEATPTDPAALAKLTKDQNTLIRDFHAGAVKIERSLQLLSDVTPLLNQFLSEEQACMLQELIEGRQQITDIRTRLEACLTSDAQARLQDINKGMATLNEIVNYDASNQAAFMAQLGQPENSELPVLRDAYAKAIAKYPNPTISNLRSELSLMSVEVFTKGLDQAKALELLSDPQLAADLRPIAKFLQNADQIQSAITTLIKKKKGNKLLAGMNSSPEAKAVLDSAKNQGMNADNVLILANTLSNQLTTDFAGGLNSALKELLKKMPEDHPMKEQVLANYQRIQQSLQ